MLNETQIFIIRAFLDQELSDIEELAANKAKIIFESIFDKNIYDNNQEVIERSNYEQAIDTIRNIIAHPHPQNRTTNGIEVQNQQEGYVYYKDDEGKLQSELKGLLGLTARGENIVTKEDVVSYIKSNIEFRIKEVNRSIVSLDNILSKYNKTNGLISSNGETKNEANSFYNRHYNKIKAAEGITGIALMGLTITMMYTTAGLAIPLSAVAAEMGVSSTVLINLLVMAEAELTTTGIAALIGGSGAGVAGRAAADYWVGRTGKYDDIVTGIRRKFGDKNVIFSDELIGFFKENVLTNLKICATSAIDKSGRDAYKARRNTTMKMIDDLLKGETTELPVIAEGEEQESCYTELSKATTAFKNIIYDFELITDSKRDKIKLDEIKKNCKLVGTDPAYPQIAEQFNELPEAMQTQFLQSIVDSFVISLKVTKRAIEQNTDISNFSLSQKQGCAIL